MTALLKSCVLSGIAGKIVFVVTKTHLATKFRETNMLQTLLHIYGNTYIHMRIATKFREINMLHTLLHIYGNTYIHMRIATKFRKTNMLQTLLHIYGNTYIHMRIGRAAANIWKAQKKEA